MALVVADRVQETTTTTGTGTYTLAGAKDGFQSFAAVGNGNTTYYACTDGTDYEVGIGTYTLSGTTLARTTIIESSNSDAAVNWGAGSKDIFVTLPASKAVVLDASGNATFAGDVTVDTDTLYVDATNNRVGINTTSPTTELHVSNRADVMIDVDGDDAAAVFKEFGGNAWRIGNRSAGDQFRIVYDEDSLGTNVRVAITTAGNVGLGTTAPSQKLDVSGNIAVSGTVDGVDIATNIPSSLGTAGQVLTVNAGATAGEWADAAGGGASAYTIDNKTAAYTVVAGDLRKIINCTSGTFTITLTAAATLGAGFFVYIWNTGTGAITIDPNASETIDGETTYILRQNEGTEIVCDGSNFSTGAKKTMRGYAENLPSTYGKPVASGAGAIALGNRNGDAVYLSQAQGTRSFAVNGYATANYSAAIGQNSSGGGAEAGGAGAMALGGSYASGADSFAAAINTNSTSYGATGDNSIAMGYLAKTAQQYSLAIGNTANASRTNSIAIGPSTVASGTGALAIGNDAHATDTNAVAIGKSARSSQNQSIAIGENCTASGITAACYGAINATASGQQAVTLGTGTASNTNAMALKGTATGNAAAGIAGGTAAGERSVAIGFRGSANEYGKFAFASGYFAAAGDAQGGQFILRADTTDATATVLTTDNTTAASTNQIVAASDTCITFDGTITAMQNGAQAYASWKVEGLLVNDGGTTTLVNSATTVISNADSWGMALSADNTNNALAITVTGEASHNIRWVANIRTTEVTYA